MRLRYLLDKLILGNRPMLRWTADEVAAEKAALEALLPEVVQTEAVYMRLVTYLVQRYPTAPRTEAEWRETQRHLQRRIREGISGKHHPEPPPTVDPNFLAWMDETLGRKPEMNNMILIESEGILYRGPSADMPAEVWDYPRKQWVKYRAAGPHQEGWGVEIDAKRAEELKTNNVHAEHFLYYDTPPWSQPVSTEYLEAITPDYLKKALAEKTKWKP
jgi:hypothetical protein